jgi:hypothetical protein
MAQVFHNWPVEFFKAGRDVIMSHYKPYHTEVSRYFCDDSYFHVKGSILHYAYLAPHELLPWLLWYYRACIHVRDTVGRYPIHIAINNCDSDESLILVRELLKLMTHNEIVYCKPSLFDVCQLIQDGNVLRRANYQLVHLLFDYGVSIPDDEECTTLLDLTFNEVLRAIQREREVCRIGTITLFLCVEQFVSKDAAREIARESWALRTQIE